MRRESYLSFEGWFLNASLPHASSCLQRASLSVNYFPYEGDPSLALFVFSPLRRKTENRGEIITGSLQQLQQHGRGRRGSDSLTHSLTARDTWKVRVTEVKLCSMRIVEELPRKLSIITDTSCSCSSLFSCP